MSVGPRSSAGNTRFVLPTRWAARVRDGAWLDTLQALQCAVHRTLGRRVQGLRLYAVKEEPASLCPLRRIRSRRRRGVPLAVLFADVRGYTSLTERLGTIEATALVNRFYEVASKAFLPLEGLLGQIAGDEVMVLFVPGLAGRSYREKAVQAGASLLEAVGYGKSMSSWIDLGIGIASGEEFVGNVGGGGFKDFTAIGDVTNTAARLTSAARAGEIVLDPATHAAIVADYPAAERELLPLKGKEAAVETFRLLLR